MELSIDFAIGYNSFVFLPHYSRITIAGHKRTMPQKVYAFLFKLCALSLAEAHCEIRSRYFHILEEERHKTSLNPDSLWNFMDRTLNKLKMQFLLL
jgi:hypothetical protein